MRRRSFISDFQKCKAIYFCMPDWTAQISLKTLDKFAWPRTGFRSAFGRGQGIERAQAETS
jgi:hypothetical protein